MESKEVETILKRIQQLEGSIDNFIKMGPLFNPESLSTLIEDVIIKTSREDDKIKHLQELIYLTRTTIVLLIGIIALLMWLAE